MNYILTDGPYRTNLLPFTFTRPVGDIRIGILTIREKWQKRLGTEISSLTEDYLAKKYPLHTEAENVVIHGSILPTDVLVKAVTNLSLGQSIIWQDHVVAYCTADLKKGYHPNEYTAIELAEDLICIKNTWDIFSKNEAALRVDFDLLTKGRKSKPIPDTNRVIAAEHIFLEEGAQVEHSILNASTGPIYLGKDSLVMEGNMIRGALALCDHAVVKMGAKMYGATTVGPYGKVGGEISNSVIFGYSSKGHDGYLGNSVLGEWCNIGADSNNSNLKNNYAKVRLWNYATERFDQTGLQFCGLMMGDHSKTAINTMFNTGTVIGVNVNVYTPGFPRNFIPSFSWGGASGFSTYQTQKAFEAAKVMMARRGVEFDDTEADILNHVFEASKKWRKE
ncbi:Glucose-1-phosphate thymidylyltransferase [Croceitalea dokdonensis DOKDO 023]|uniref:Glucose-1-phosphate thymidylyltransferase n=1 Tax=Croceitalea dokdonensis DOKDO 023 TaxID=1300341 RepID=A0A0P7AHW4_9FLAO|nr:GlmU family protein [Croceitalea dokdonensis]KPM33184.1 Glucose-1-phosphate thymidylyltransferase [Croceitalea dokdonensis DOKDO 023]